MRLVVYNEAPDWPLKEVERQLQGLGVELDVRPALPARVDQPEKREAWLAWLAWHLAWSKVRNPERRIPAGLEPKPREVELERRALTGEARIPGPLYDARRLVEAFHGPLPARHQAFDPDRPVIVLTDRLVGTFEGTRYHVRFLTTGHPTLVSPPGLIDGPARDRSFYMAKQVLGASAEAFARDDHLTRQDDRLPTALTSALLQAALYHDGGDPFCEHEACRLFNPHWQEDLLATMATEQVCEDHAAWLAGL